MRQARSGLVYKPVRKILDAPLTRRIEEIAQTRVRYSYQRIHILLRREGWLINRKRVHRLYKLARLYLRSKRPRRRRAAADRLDRPVLTAPNQSWSMDFVSDALFDGRRFRSLTVVDHFSRECLAIVMGQRLRGEDVVETLEYLRQERGSPRRVQADNGPEFISIVLDKWAYDHDVTIDFSRPGKPADNALVESFNGSCPLTTPVRRSKTGEPTTIISVRIRRWEMPRQRSSPRHFGQPQTRRFFCLRSAQDLGGRQGRQRTGNL